MYIKIEVFLIAELILLIFYFSFKLVISGQDVTGLL